VEAGTLLAPQRNSTSQTLVVKKDRKICLPRGESTSTIDTMCYDMEKPAPNKDEIYYIGNIRAAKYQEGMNQTDVWEITVDQKDRTLKI
jgi:hypothetical protein